MVEAQQTSVETPLPEIKVILRQARNGEPRQTAAQKVVARRAVSCSKIAAPIEMSIAWRRARRSDKDKKPKKTSSKVTLTGPLEPVDKTVISKAINHGSHEAGPAHTKLSKVESWSGKLKLKKREKTRKETQKRREGSPSYKIK